MAFTTENGDVFIKSDDGLKLHATLLRNKSNKNCVICFHGYSSKGLNDYGSISKFYIEQGFNMLLVDHMTMDAQAIVMFFKDIIQIYCHKAYDIDYPKSLASFIKALEKDLKYEANSKALQKDREYWTEVLKQGEPMYADMTGDNLLERQREERNNPNLRAAVCGIQSCDAEIAQFHLEPNPSDWLVTFCEKNNISMATLLLMALRTYLQKVNNNQTDISVQNTVSRRATLAEKNSGGTRIHFFPCRTIVNLDETFLEGCYKIRDAQNAVFRHARYCHKN